MSETILIGTYGLSDKQIEFIKTNIPNKKCEVMDTDCFTDIIATYTIAAVVMWNKLQENDKGILVDYYTQIDAASEALFLIGNKEDIPKTLLKSVSVYPSFEEFTKNAKYVLLGAYNRKKKNENYSAILSKCILILSLMRKKNYITTKEIAEKLECSERTAQRYIETLRAAGEWIEYDVSHKGWTLLAEGKSILWGDI